MKFSDETGKGNRTGEWGRETKTASAEVVAGNREWRWRSGIEKLIIEHNENGGNKWF